MKKCIHCNEEKDITEFYKCKSCKQGVQALCSKCYMIKYKKRYHSKTRLRKDTDKEIGEHVLKALGYDLEGVIPVHEQFINKMNEKYGINLK